MENPFKPESYNSVSPYFIVDGAQRLVDLLTQLFDAQELRRFAGEHNTIGHIELRIDDSVIMLADSMPTYPANQFLMHVYVADVYHTFEKAIALGCESVEEPINKPGDPDVRGTFRDFAGNVWAIGTQRC